MTSAKVLDASAVCAMLFGEPQGAHLGRRVARARLLAPLLIDYEVSNTCLSKMRRHPHLRSDLMAAYHDFLQLPLDRVAVDTTKVLALAEQCGLTVYDASYLWLARQLGVELVTLDKALIALMG